MNSPITYRPMLHRLAVGLAALTFPLIWVGGLVTTYEAGMAVEDWPTTYGYNLFLYPWQKWVYGPFDLFVEHGHRLLASIVGLVTIALLVLTWRLESRRWVKWFAFGLLILVIGQGLLGGARVEFDKRLLARIHGCVGPAFFAASVAFATVTSASWMSSKSLTATSNTTLWTTMLFAAVYMQLVIGAHLRHLTVDTSQTAFRAFVFFHLVVAAMVVYLAWTTFVVCSSAQFGVARSLLLVLVGFQIVLGLGAWVVKYSWPDWMQSFGFAANNVVVAQSLYGSVIRTAHVANGSALLGLACHLCCRAWQIAPNSWFNRSPIANNLRVAL